MKRRRVLACFRWLMLCASTMGCARRAPAVESATACPAPAREDHGAVCADVGELRGCWSEAGPRIVPRPLPAGAAPPSGWRCSGRGAARTCEDPRHNGDAFVCAANSCVQARPRMPDDGEWECVEMNGIVFCHSRADAAGIAAGPSDSGWLCGARRGVNSSERVCIDLAPDRPSAHPDYRCAFEYPHAAAVRVCKHGDTRIAGDACGPALPCADGMRCVDQRCLPAQLAPACWLDRDCGAGSSCRWGSCTGHGA